MGEWDERDHPRNPEDGKFVEKIGGGGWAQRISDAIGSGRLSSPGGGGHSPGDTVSTPEGEGQVVRVYRDGDGNTMVKVRYPGQEFDWADRDENDPEDTDDTLDWAVGDVTPAAPPPSPRIPDPPPYGDLGIQRGVANRQIQQRRDRRGR